MPFSVSGVPRERDKSQNHGFLHKLDLAVCKQKHEGGL